MDVSIETSWKRALADEFTKPYFKELSTFVRSEYLSTKVYPPPKFVFRAFALTPFEEVRVVILGQDPYHGTGQAHGLCFSVPEGVRVPPSLQNIYKELRSDLGLGSDVDAEVTGRPTSGLDEASGNLEAWATQGVLLLNATLTVRANSPGSHQHKGWETFTDAVIRALSEKREHLVFLLWGKYAKDKGVHIDTTKHLVLTAAHPSPFSAANGFFGCRHFSQTNAYLRQHGSEPIQWY